MTTPTITVSADQWADLVIKRSGWVAVEGSYCCLHAPSVIERYRGYGIDVDDRSAPCLCAPPAWLVEASKPCMTCQGSGTSNQCCDGDDDHETTDDCYFQCHACKGHGKPLVAVETECEQPITAPVGPWHEVICRGGNVFVGYVTVREVWPTHDVWGLPALLPESGVVVDVGNGNAWITDIVSRTHRKLRPILEIDLPDAQPGMYAVHIEMVTP